jgi:hypothetical protein
MQLNLNNLEIIDDAPIHVKKCQVAQLMELGEQTVEKRVAAKAGAKTV